VSLEKDSHQLSSCKLQVKLVIVFFLDHRVVVIVKVLIVFLLLLSPALVSGVVFGNALKRLVHYSDSLLTKILNFLLGHETFTDLVDNIFEGINLRNQSVCFCLLKHGFSQIGREHLAHVVQVLVHTIYFLDAADEAWQTLSTRGADAVVGIKVSESQKHGSRLVHVWDEGLLNFINEHGQHLNGNVLLINLISDDIKVLFLGVVVRLRLDLMEHILQGCECIRARDSHGGRESCAVENSWKDVLQIGSEFSLHEQADALPGTKQVHTLSVTLFELIVLDVEQHLDDVMSDWGEGLLANCSADDRDGLNDLATELLILGLEKLV